MDILCDSFVHFNDFNIIFVVRYRARSLCGEVYAGLAGIGGVALYYLVIYLFRDKLANDFVFYIKEK